ncbi:MAG: SGNH/GDSL hydrolase family protein [Candidatus Sulfotelmatobacter sp.]
MSQVQSQEKTQEKHVFLKTAGLLLAFCLFLELFLRLFGYGSYTTYRPDERLLWVPVAGHSLTVINHLPETFNDQGFRRAEDVKAKQPGEFRVIAFGDSSTQGWGVGDNSTYSADLEKLLGQSGCSRKHFEVIDAGVNAYPNALVAEKLKEVLQDNVVQPDIAIVAYSYNSNFEKLTKLQGPAREAFLRRVRMKAILRRSAIYNFVVEGILRRLVYYKLRHVIMAGTLSSLGGMEALDMDYFNQGLQQSVDLARAHHVQLVLLMLGSKGQTMNEAELFPFQKAMIEFAEKEHVPMVNMIPVVSGKDQDAVFLDPVHPSVEGHEIIAQQLLHTVESLPPYEEVCGGTTKSAVAETSTH